MSPVSMLRQTPVGSQQGGRMPFKPHLHSRCHTLYLYNFHSVLHLEIMVFFMLARSEVFEGSSLHLSLSLHRYSQHFIPQTFNTQGPSVAGGAGYGCNAGKECLAEG